MILGDDRQAYGSVSDPTAAVPLHDAWTTFDGPLVGVQVRPERRYSVVRLGSADYAYTSYERYVRALGQGWDAGIVPEPPRSARGDELPNVAPNLRGVDVDPGDLSAGRETGRFS